MENVLNNKKINKASFVALIAFLIARSAILLDPLSIVLGTSGFAVEGGFKNTLFLVLTVVYCIFVGVIVFEFYKAKGEAIIPLAILLISDPKHLVLQGSVLDAFVGILMLLTVIIIHKVNQTAGDTVMWIFSAVSALILPMSLFSTFPIVLCVRYFSDSKENRRFYPIAVSAAAFVLGSFVRIMLYKRNVTFFVEKMFEYSGSGEFADKIGYTLSSADFYAYFVTLVSIIVLFCYYSRLNRNLPNLKKTGKAKRKKQLQGEITVVGIAMILTVAGEIAYHRYSVAFMLLMIVFIMLVIADDENANKILIRLNELIDNHFILFMFVLIILAGINVKISGVSALYRRIGFDFTA